MLAGSRYDGLYAHNGVFLDFNEKAERIGFIRKAYLLFTV